MHWIMCINSEDVTAPNSESHWHSSMDVIEYLTDKPCWDCTFVRGAYII